MREYKVRVPRVGECMKGGLGVEESMIEGLRVVECIEGGLEVGENEVGEVGVYRRMHKGRTAWG